MKTRKRPSKIDDTLLIKKVIECVFEDRYCIAHHAYERMAERGITLEIVKATLIDGCHVKRKDQWSEEFQCWKYAFEKKI